ncbi:MAG: arginine--tRNA ligase, partial [Patescibacteria group bacterium]
MKEDLLKVLEEVVSRLGINADSIKLDYPDNLEHGDYSTNIAMLSAKNLKINPRELAEKIVAGFKNTMPDFIESVSVAGQGFINFKLKNEVFIKKVIEISNNGEEYGRSNIDIGKTILIEHTDPNTFKAFHIGHLMTNAIGESLSRLIDYCGAKTIRICYPSDIGLHIAKSVWAIQKHLNEMPTDNAPIIERTTFLGKMYVEGTNAYDADTAVKNDIDALNQVIYEKNSQEINVLYEKGRKWSLDHFELLYKILDTKFDEYIFESAMAPIGLEIVRAYLAKEVFEKSEGAVVFRGERYGLHTRVFINSHGLPTYEAKEIGLN